MRNTPKPPPKPPPKPRPIPARRADEPTAPDLSRQPDRRWQRTVRYGWDKGGAHGGRK